MRKTVYAKFMLGYLIFAVTALLYISYEYKQNILEHEISSTALSMYNHVTGISEYYSSRYYHVDDKSSEHDYNSEIKGFMLPDDTSLWIVSNDGRILYSSDRRDIGTQLGVFTKYFDSNFYTTTDFGGILEEPIVSVYSPIVNTYKTYGYIMMNRTVLSVKESFMPLSNHIYGAFLFIFAFSLIIIPIFHLTVYRPIRRLKRAAGEYAKGNFEYQGLNIRSEDEFGDIAQKLRLIAKEMQETDNNQKKFIANISHDFRSPLTSIKGYIEAMLDGTIPPEQYDKYMNILLFETERLNKLTDSLLTLNMWDSRGSTLNLSDFDIVQMTRNIVASFEVQCSKKKITMDVLFGSKSYIVSADNMKIQQVLYNLIDNAIKFSHANSSIGISVTDKNDKVFISVKDSGIGIPKESLNKIWNRFYKTDISRGKDKTGSGLGLSIVKEVISSHNENINVISTEGVGTEFIFTLQKAKKPLLPVAAS